MRRWLAKSFWVQAGLCMLGAALVRTAFLLRAQGMLDGDEAVLGIQAEQILRGAHPVYFAGQVYMGALDAYLIAPLVALLGPSAWALRLPVLLESLLLIPLSGALAQRLYGRRARLPALVLAAVPALYVTVGQLRVLGGYIETLVLGAAAMLTAVTLVDRLSRGEPIRWLLAGLGLLAGVVFWIAPISLDDLAAIGLWASLPVGILAWRAIEQRAFQLQPVVLGAATAVCAFVVGYAPAVAYAVTHHYANVKWLLVLLRGGNPTYATGAGADRLRLGALQYLLTCALPRLTGAYPLWSPPEPIPLLEYVGLVCAILALVYSLYRMVRRIQAARRLAHPGTMLLRAWMLVLPVLLVAVVGVAYWRSSFSDGWDSGFDSTGRYVLPAATGLILMLAYVVGDMPLLLRQLGRGLRAWAGHTRLNAAARAGRGRAPYFAVVATLAILVAANLTQYVSADAVLAMQSPYRSRDRYPAVDSQMLAYLNQHNIRFVWTIHWLGNVLMYQSDGRITAADMRFHDRFLQNVQTLEHADGPSYIIEADPVKGECAVAKALDAMHVTYTAVPFQHWWIITPLSRAVSPSEIQPAIAPDYDA